MPARRDEYGPRAGDDEATDRQLWALGQGRVAREAMLLLGLGSPSRGASQPLSHHDDPGPRLFSFAVIADSHVEPPRADEPRSNRRLRLTVAAVRALRPAFALHLGDIVHPLPELASAAAAWDEALALLGGLGCPLHVTPGNHDIGDKPNPMMPAAAVRPDWLKRYTRVAGPARKVVDHAGCRLVLLEFRPP